MIEQRDQVLAGQDGSFAPLIVVEAVDVERESGLNRLIEQIGLGESELNLTQASAELRAEAERFAQPKKIVGGVGEPDEAA